MTWGCKSCHGLRIVEGKGMGLDYIYNSTDYWNYHRHNLCFDNVCWSISNTGSNLLGNIVSAIVSIAINAVILYYLFRPHVKAYFGKTMAA